MGCYRVPEKNIRLLFEEASGREGFRDFASVSEAREALTEEMVDWVIFELRDPNVPGVRGRTLDSSEGP